MSDVANQEHRKWATQAVARFVGRFDESYLFLAYHAALPLVLTPELVNYLRNQFLRGEQVPWVAEVDLLLSDLCSQVGYELYAMDTHVRDYLLEQMEQDSRFGEQRMGEVAQVLISYVNYLKRLNPQRRKQEIEAQRLAAMVYLGDEECKTAAREIAESLLEITSGTGTGSENLNQLEIKAQLARLTRITEELSRPLKKREQKSLLKYARLVQQILRNPDQVNPDELNNSFDVEGVSLRFTDKFLPEPLAKTLVAPRNKVVQFPGFPATKIFTFEVAIFEEGTHNLQPFEFEVALIEINQSIQNSQDISLETVDEEVFSKTGQNLNDLERLVIQGTLANLTYEQIAASAPPFYSVHHYKNIGIKLWKVLSEVFGEKVTKRTLQNVLKHWIDHRRLIVNRHRQQAQCFIEDLGNDVRLEMVSIPEGSFMMGSPKEELESYDDERPQHRVTVPSFYIGRYPITQAQWKAVAELEQVSRKLDPDPSNFKENYKGIDRWQRAVEQVSWDDAKEFCDRLSQKTGMKYRLPTEAEWEYACRGGTTTPFHFGETITTELANYDGNYVYGAGVKGKYREETTEVGSFPGNEFGLCDMHGNVWEWCEDDWHENYEGAPNDGSAWLTGNNNMKVVRGGSWDYSPHICRSAFRNYVTRDDHLNYFGFRVVCVAPRTT